MPRAPYSGAARWQSRWQSTSRHQTGLWRSSWIRPPGCTDSTQDYCVDLEHHGSGGWGFESLVVRRTRRSAPIKQEKLDGRVSGSVSPWVLSAVSRPAERYSCCCLRVWSRRLVTVSASRRDATCCRPGIGTADPSRQHAGDDGWLSSSTCRGTA